MNFETLTAEHVIRMGPLVDVHSASQITPELALDLELVGGLAAVRDNGDVIAIAGIMPQWRGSGISWAWLAQGWRLHARAITEKMREMLDGADYHRIELAVRCDFDRGHAWARRLGFDLETPCAKAWGPDRKDYSIYTRVRLT